MTVKSFEDLDIYRLAERLADSIWALVLRWPDHARGTIGRQLVRAADSVGANIAEGSGRGSARDTAHFARIARGSFYEVRHFLRRAFSRELIDPEQVDELKLVVEELGPKLNAFIRAMIRRQQQGTSNK